MERPADQATTKYLDLGTFRVYEREIPNFVPNHPIRDFLGTLIKLTSQGYRMQVHAIDGLANGLYFMLASKRLQRVELFLNGHTDPNYGFKVAYPKETIQGMDIPSVEERIRLLKAPLAEFDGTKMERNLLEDYPLFRFHLNPTDEYDDRVLKSLTRSIVNPNTFEYEAKSLVPPER